MVIGMSF